MSQIAFAQRIREFVRALVRRVVPGIPLERLQIESDLIFETHVNQAVYSLPETASDYDRRCAVVKVMCTDAARLLVMLKNACKAVGLEGVANEYLNHATFFNFILEQDNSKMDLLMSVAENNDPDLARVFFNIARVLKGKDVDYYKLGDDARRKASDDIMNFAAEVRDIIERVGAKVALVEAAVQAGFAQAGQKMQECRAAIAAVDAKVSKLRRSGKAKGRYADEAKTLCWHYWKAANNREEVWRSVNTRITYKSVFEYGQRQLASVGVTSVSEYKAIVQAVIKHRNREMANRAHLRTP